MAVCASLFTVVAFYLSPVLVASSPPDTKEDCANPRQKASGKQCLLQSGSVSAKTSLGDDVAAKSGCKSWCATKVAKGTLTWDSMCTWEACSDCSDCPTTTTTTGEYTPYCSGVASLAQTHKKTSSATEDFARKVARENQAMLYHHSYCGKSKSSRLDVKKHSEHANSSQTNRGMGRDTCHAFTSKLSPNGLANCDGSKSMPYAYAYHLHPTYDGDSRNAAKALSAALQSNFGIGECTDTDEKTVYSTKERLCLMSTVKGCSKKAPESPEDVTAIFPMCQFGIYVRAGAMFDDSMGADGTSLWQWMSLNKDCFGAQIDVIGHAVMCPKLAHGEWAFFVNGTHNTTAATWITGDNSVDGCYGQECQPAECTVAEGVLDGTAVYDSGCCAATALASVPKELDSLMAKTYSNLLKFQTSSGWWDVETKSMKDYSEYQPEFPSTVWPGGTCHGDCEDLQ
jgi:hypothetical protein